MAQLDNADAVEYIRLIAARLQNNALGYLQSWRPEGELKGKEYCMLNPHNPKQPGKTRKLGSFSCDVNTGEWHDFATGDKGGDLVSLYAFLFDKKNYEAARELDEGTPPPPMAKAKPKKKSGFDNFDVCVMPAPPNAPGFFDAPFVADSYDVYGHFILGMVRDDDNAIFILGVPGVYSDAEKDRAHALGITEFKCYEPTAPADGEFGYWLLGMV